VALLWPAWSASTWSPGDRTLSYLLLLQLLLLVVVLVLVVAWELVRSPTST
jgi:hypothetical protein